jgi:hypothetical protein
MLIFSANRLAFAGCNAAKAFRCESVTDFTEHRDLQIRDRRGHFLLQRDNVLARRVRILVSVLIATRELLGHGSLAMTLRYAHLARLTKHAMR